LDDIKEKFEVSDIDQIVLTGLGSGSEELFSEYFEYRAAIGHGGFGFVIAALDKETGEEIAIKMLRKDKAPDVVIDMFKKEAEILQSFHENTLNHSKSTDSRSSSRIYANPENLIEFRFYKEYANYICLGMELCTGGNLTEWIEDQRKLTNKSQQAHEED
jgi:serine/threonine protein kinase